MTRKETDTTELLSPQDQRKMEVQEKVFGEFSPTAEQIEELKPKYKEPTNDWLNRMAYFTIQQVIYIGLTTEDEGLALKCWMHLNSMGVTPTSAIDISIRKSPMDDMDEDELIEKMVDRLLKHPQGRKLIEDKMGRSGEKWEVAK